MRENHQYDDIIHLPHPTSKNHKRMSPLDRAAQFSPFAALSGHEEAVWETARLTEEKQILSDDAIAQLNSQLNLIAENIGEKLTVTITYFVPDDKKAGGAYKSCSGTVKEINRYSRTVLMSDKTVIPMEQISGIEIENGLFRETGEREENDDCLL